jgi:hypothetical protein
MGIDGRRLAQSVTHVSVLPLTSIAAANSGASAVRAANIRYARRSAGSAPSSRGNTRRMARRGPRRGRSRPLENPVDRDGRGGSQEVRIEQRGVRVRRHFVAPAVKPP